VIAKFGYKKFPHILWSEK